MHSYLGLTVSVVYEATEIYVALLLFLQNIQALLMTVLSTTSNLEGIAKNTVKIAAFSTSKEKILDIPLLRSSLLSFEIMPYAVVIWKRGSHVVDIAGLKPDDMLYLEKIPCLSSRLEVDTEGFIRFGPTAVNKHTAVKPAVVLTGLEVLGFKVVTTTAVSSPTKTGTSTEYSWTLRREFAEPEPQD